MDFLPPEVQILLAAASYAMATIFVRLGLRKATIPMAAVVVQTIPALIFGAVLLFKSTPPLMARGILFFIIGGLSAPGVAGLLRFLGLIRLGVGRSAAVVGSTPIFAVLLAAFFLRERPGFFLWLGVGLIVAGVGLLSRKEGEERWRKRDLIIPLMCALFVAVGATFRKAGLDVVPSSTLGVFFSTSAGVGAFLIFSPLFPQGGGLHIERDALNHLIPGGLCASLGHLFFFGALSGGSISLVMPLFQAQPLFTILAAYLFLKELESVSRFLVFGALMIVAGAVLVVTFKPV